MCPFILGKRFVIHIDNRSILRISRGTTKQDVVVRRLVEIQYWYPDITFIAEKDTRLDYLLSTTVIPLHHTHVDYPLLSQVNHSEKGSTPDERLVTIQDYLQTGTWPAELSSMDICTLSQILPLFSVR